MVKALNANNEIKFFSCRHRLLGHFRHNHALKVFYLQAAIAGAAAWWFFIREGENEQIPDVSTSTIFVIIKLENTVNIAYLITDLFEVLNQ